jgi:membrane-associated protein
MLNVTEIIQYGGLVLLGAFLFAEVGLFLGFFLPGDTLLIAAGIYAKQGKLNIAGVIVVAAIAATAGDSMAYFIGYKLGPRVFRNKDSLLFRPDHVKKAELIYDKYGSRAVLMAHFLPVVRTFTPLLAGIAKMPYRKFLTFDATGDTAWAITVSLLGYYVGSRIPGIDHYILIAVACVVIATLGPTLFQVIRVSIKRRSARKKSKITD